ncbi:MAG: imidazole glycerol phosphate synthase subunit HisF [Leptospiraceae bacterium]|nr:imidazole glycerol phosphate synthase subunit HisF [Leptospiraceae bacterium]
MLKHRIIPTLLWKNSTLVKGVKFDSSRRVGSLVPAIKVYRARDVDELVVLDIAATSERRQPDFNLIEEIAPLARVPLSVGGGISQLDDITRLLHAGADKVVINSALYTNPEIVSNGARRFGSQCIVASIDVRRDEKGEPIVFSHSGTRRENQSLDSVVARVIDSGAGEILLTSMDQDGTMEGFDIELIRQVARHKQIPVIASGGAGQYDHFVEAIRDGGASAVAAASIFHFTHLTPGGARDAMGAAGLPVRKGMAAK